MCRSVEVAERKPEWLRDLSIISFCVPAKVFPILANPGFISQVYVFSIADSLQIYTTMYTQSTMYYIEQIASSFTGVVLGIQKSSLKNAPESLWLKVPSVLRFTEVPCDGILSIAVNFAKYAASNDRYYAIICNQNHCWKKNPTKHTYCISRSII